MFPEHSKYLAINMYAQNCGIPFTVGAKVQKLALGRIRTVEFVRNLRQALSCDIALVQTRSLK